MKFSFSLVSKLSTTTWTSHKQSGCYSCCGKFTHTTSRNRQVADGINLSTTQDWLTQRSVSAKSELM